MTSIARGRSPACPACWSPCTVYVLPEFVTPYVNSRLFFPWRRSATCGSVVSAKNVDWLSADGSRLWKTREKVYLDGAAACARRREARTVVPADACGAMTTSVSESTSSANSFGWPSIGGRMRRYACVSSTRTWIGSLDTPSSARRATLDADGVRSADMGTRAPTAAGAGRFSGDSAF